MKYIIVALISIVLTGLAFQYYFSKKVRKSFTDGKKFGEDELLKLFFQCGYESKVREFSVTNKYTKPGGYVFLGDSITQGYNVYEYFSDMLVYNRGIGGDTTSGVLKRLKESVYDLNPKKVILLIGTNDYTMLNATAEDVCKNLEKIIDHIRNNLPDVEILLQSIYPISQMNSPKIDKLSVGQRTNEVIDQTNEMLKNLKGVTYIDIASQLKDNQGNLKLDYTVEGLHINEQGYSKITEILNSYLQN